MKSVQKGDWVEFTDITETTVFFSVSKVANLILNLSEPMRRYSKCLALAQHEPDEIWSKWEEPISQSGQWELMRTYLQTYEFDEASEGERFAIAVARYVYRTRWEAHSFDVLTGDSMEAIVQQANDLYRIGKLIYSKA